MADGTPATARPDLRQRAARPWTATLRWIQARSLRARLLAVTLALAAIGLTVAGFVTYGSLKSFLVDRVDTQLAATQGSAIRAIGGRGGGLRPGEVPKGFVAQLYDRDGALSGYVLDGAIIDGLYQQARDGYETRDLGSRGSYRLLYDSVDTRFGRGPGSTFPDGDFQLVVGIPLDDVQSTLGRLVWIEFLVGLGALAAIGGLGFWLIRLGLRPLSDIEHTAAAIAGGDLSRRIDVTAPGTEVGSLSTSLNTMLGTIEASFAEREESERRLRQFVADASHELQTPLTSVRGYAELFRRGAADNPDDLATAMSRIESEAKRMGLLVDDLLMLARLDQGRPLERERVDLVSLARDLVGDARVVDPDRPIEMDVNGPVVVIGDEARLRQVVTNLLSNARTHTPPGTPVTVRVAVEAHSALIEVADRGPGMHADHAARVFERFFRADASRARASGGSGLGLSIVAAIARAHGGSVDVVTHPGDGATFTVRLPLEPPADSQATPSLV